MKAKEDKLNWREDEILVLSFERLVKEFTDTGTEVILITDNV